MDELKYPHKTWMTVDLFHVGDIVSPSCGALAGKRGIVVNVGRYITIMFPRVVKKYPNELRPAQREWRYEPSNVRLEAFPRRRLRVDKS